MKKKILSLFTVFSAFLISAVPCSAKGVLSEISNQTAEKFNFDSILSAFTACTSAQVALAFTVVCLVLFFIFRKKMCKRLNNSSASSMMNAFLIFFSFFGICCFSLALLTDGKTWSHLMFFNPESEYALTQFSDYILGIQHAGKGDFISLADRFTPMGILIYNIIAQFLPPKLVLSDSMEDYVKILKNQTFMLLYLFIVMFCLVLIYKMNRSVLRNNGLKVRDEFVAFLTVVSYPAMYCVEQGNIAGIGVVLTLFFTIFYASDNQILRELAHLTLAFSAALNPIMILFIPVFFTAKTKRTRKNIVKILCYTLILYIIPAFVTGFDCLGVYIQSLFAVTKDTFVASNMSIANLLVLFGVNDIVILNIVCVTMNAIAVICAFVLPASWQKMTAVIYVVLNIYSFSTPVNLIFIFIPLIFLLSEKTHKASDWLYLLVFALLVTPFPEWFWFELSDFNNLMLQFNIKNIRNANNLISLASVQSLFILIMYTAMSNLINKKKAPAISQDSSDAQTA